MKKIIILLFLVCFQTIAFGQNQQKEKSLQVDVGIGMHGTGDMPGYGFNVDYKKFLRKRIALSFGIGATIHDGSFPVSFLDDKGNQIDGSVRYGSSGFQLNSKLGISIIKTRKIDAGLQAGIIGRYESSSVYDQINVWYPPMTELPVPVIVLINKSPQRTLSLGGISHLYCNYYINTNVFIGLTSSFQTNLDGDVISQLMISIGSKF